MSSIKVESITEQAAYVVKQMGLMRTDMQEFWVDLGAVYPRSVAVPFLLDLKGLPQPFQQYSLNNLQYSKNITHVQDKGIPNLWIVSVEWATITDVQQSIADPTERPALISQGTYKEQNTPTIDFDGKPLTTTAGELIDFTYQKGFTTWQLEKKLYPFPDQYSNGRDFVNNDQVVIYVTKYPPYSLFTPEINVSYLQWEGNFPYHQFSATIYVNMEPDPSDPKEIRGWRNLKRNAGYHELNVTGYQARVGNRASGKAKGPIYKTVADAPLDTKVFPVYSYQAIRMGTPGKYSYPSSPVLLDAKGQAFRERLPADLLGPANAFGVPSLKAEKDIVNTGPVIGLSTGNGPAATTGITKKQWDAAVVEGKLYNFVSYNKLFPFITDRQTPPPGLRANT